MLLLSVGILMIDYAIEAKKYCIKRMESDLHRTNDPKNARDLDGNLARESIGDEGAGK